MRGTCLSLYIVQIFIFCDQQWEDRWSPLPYESIFWQNLAIWPTSILSHSWVYSAPSLFNTIKLNILIRISNNFLQFLLYIIDKLLIPPSQIKTKNTKEKIYCHEAQMDNERLSLAEKSGDQIWFDGDWIKKEFSDLIIKEYFGNLNYKRITK